ncbi:hypothetical protein D3C72_1672090 [compost metagenome]
MPVTLPVAVPGQVTPEGDVPHGVVRAIRVMHDAALHPLGAHLLPRQHRELAEVLRVWPVVQASSVGCSSECQAGI